MERVSVKTMGGWFVQYRVRLSFLDGTDFDFFPPKESFSGRSFASLQAFSSIKTQIKRKTGK